MALSIVKLLTTVAVAVVRDELKRISGFKPYVAECDGR